MGAKKATEPWIIVSYELKSLLRDKIKISKTSNIHLDILYTLSPAKIK